MDTVWPITLVASCAIVVAFALVGFNQPSWSRTYTSVLRFRFAAIAHAAMYLLVIGVIYALLRRLLSTTPSDTLTLALLLTLVVRFISPLSGAVRRAMHRLAGVPQNAQHLARVLASAELVASEQIRKEARDVLSKRGVDVTNERVPIVQPVQRLLLKATTLFIQLRAWESDRKYSRFVAEAQHEFNVLRSRFDQMSFRVSRVLSTIERLGEVRHCSQTGGRDASARLDELLRTVVSDLIADSCEEIDSFHESACLIAARGALVTRWTYRGRIALTKSLGFIHRRDLQPGAMGILAQTFVLLFIGMWAYFNLLPAEDLQISTKARISIVTIIVFGSFAIAIVPKLRWGFANGGLHERTPIPFVLGAGAAAMAFSVGVNLIAGAILMGGISGAVSRLSMAAPYLPASFITAATVAVLVQDHRWRQARSNQTRRLLDAMVLAGAWLIASSLAMALRVQFLHVDYPLATDTLLILGCAVAFGAVLGYFIPETVRVKTVGADKPHSSTPPLIVAPGYPAVAASPPTLA